jgi:hypothetical protein
MVRKKLDYALLEEAHKLAFDSLDKDEMYRPRGISIRITEAYSALLKNCYRDGNQYGNRKQLRIKRKWARKLGWDSRVFRDHEIIKGKIYPCEITKYFYIGEEE